MQPYQEASGQIKRQGEAPLRALKTAGNIAVTAFGGISLARVLPLLSKLIPPELAIKGLTKLDPRFGKFINKSLSMGKTFDEVRDFIKQEAQPEEKENANEEPMQPYAGGHNEPFQGEGALNTIDPNQHQEQPEQGQEQGQQRNIIQQYSPELFQFLAQEIGNGRNPLDAAAIAQNDKRFQGVIAKIQKQTKMKWSDIIAKIFGQQQQMAQGIPHQGQQQQQQSQGQLQPQQVPGQGAQALMAAIQELKKIRGG